jgi:hypothetical protein
MAQDIRPVPQKVGRGDDPDKIMVANRKVGSTQTPEQAAASSTAAQSTREGLSELANTEPRPHIPDAQTAWKQRRVTKLMRNALSAKGTTRKAVLEGLPGYITKIAEQKDPSEEGGFMTRLLLKRGQKTNKKGNRKGIVPVPQNWDEVREQMIAELKAKGRNEEAEQLSTADDTKIYKMYTDPKAKELVVATLLAMTEDQAERMRAALDKVGLKP